MADQLVDQLVAAGGMRSSQAYDGDTFKTPEGQRVRVRGYDAPEMSPYQPGANLARDTLQQILNSGAEVKTDGKDRYGRDLATVSQDGDDITNRLIDAGLAVPYKDTATAEQMGAARGAVMRRAVPAWQTPTDQAFLADRAANPTRIDLSNQRLLSPKQTPGITSDAFDRGIAGMKQSFGLAAEYLGQKLGVDTVRDWGADLASKAAVDAALSPARVESFEDARGFAEVGTWAYEKVIENIPQIAAMATGAGAGAGLAAGVGKAFLKKAVTDAAKKSLTAWGARAGAVATTYPQHVGEGFKELKEIGLTPDDTNLPLLTGAINTVLDVAPMEALLRFSFNGLKPDMAKDLVRKSVEQLARDGVLKSMAKGFGKGALAGAAAEGPTELTQEIVNLTARAYHDPNFRWDAPEVKSRLKEAFAGGLAVGSVFGGAGRAAGQGAAALRAPGQLEPPKLPGEDVAVDETALPATPPTTPATSPEAPGTGAATPTWDTLKPGQAVTLYRGESAENDQNGQWWTTDRFKAERYGAVHEVTLPAEVVATHAARGHNGADEFVFPGQRPDQLLASNDALVAHTGESEADLNAQVEALRAGRKFGILISERQTPNAATARLETGAERGALDVVEVPGKGLLYLPAGSEAAVTVQQAVAAGDARAINQLLGQITQGVSPEVAAVPPSESTAVLENLDAQGNAVSQVRVNDQTVEQAAADTAGQGVEQRVVSAEQAQTRRAIDPDTLFGGVDTDPQQPTASTEVSQQQAANEFPVGTGPGPSPELQRRQAERNRALEVAAETSATEVEVGAEGSGISLPSQSTLDFELNLGEPEPKDQIQAITRREKKEAGKYTPSAFKAVSSIRRVLRAVLADMNRGARWSSKPRVSKTNEGLRVQLDLPEEIARNETSKRFIEKLVRAAFVAQVKGGQSISVRSPKAWKIQDAELRLNVPELVEAGFELLGTGIKSVHEASKTEVRQALLASISWFLGKGFTLTNNSLPADDTIVIPGKHNKTTWARLKRDIRGPSTGVDVERLIADLDADELRAFYLEAKQEQFKLGRRDENGNPVPTDPSDPKFRQQLAEQERWDRAVNEIERLIYREDAAEATDSDPDSMAFKDHPVQDQSPWVDRLETNAVGDISDPGDVREENTEGDNRAFETERKQNEQSDRRRYEYHDPEPITTKGNLIKGSSTKSLTQEAEGIARLLNLAGVNLEDGVRLADEGGIPQLTAWAAQTGIKENIDMIAALVADKPVARVLFLRTGKGKQVRPVIYLSKEFTDARTRARSKAILHEVGHVVLRHFVETATDAQKKMLAENFGTGVEFEENFANAFMEWVQAQTTNSKSTVGGAVKTFFQKLYDTLRKLWLAGRRTFKVDDKYSDFIQAIFNRNLPNERREMKTEFGRRLEESIREAGDPRANQLTVGPYDYLNWTPKPKLAKIAANRRFQQMAKQSKRGLETLQRASKSVYEVMLQPFDSHARGIGNKIVTAFANEFYHRPGTEQDTSGKTRWTFDDEIRTRIAPFMTRINKIATEHQKKRHFFDLNPPMSEDLKIAVEQNIAGKPETPLAKEISQFFADMYEELTRNGVHIPFRKNYFPVAMSLELLSKEGAKERVITAVKDWAKTDEAKKWWAEKFKDPGGKPRQLTEQDAQRFGEHLYSVWTTGEGLMQQDFDNSFDFVAPGFSHRKQRQIPPDLMARFDEFRDRDVVRLMNAYARSGMRRSAWQRRFGLNAEANKVREAMEVVTRASREYKRTKKTPAEVQVVFDELAAKYKGTGRLPTVGEAFDLMWQRAKDKVEPKLKQQLEDAGIDVFDPSAKLKLDLYNEVREGRLSQQDYDWVTGTLIPGYEGTLGADMTIFGRSRPGFRRFSSMMIAYQMFRVLSLGVFSQVVDIGAAMNRAPPEARWQLAGQFIKGVLSKRTRQEMIEDARLIGAIHDDITEHLLSSDSLIFGGMDKTQKLTSAFFKVNGMHYLTNWSRAVNMSFIKQQVKQWAKEGNKKALAEIGITVEEAQAWVADGIDGMPMQYQGKHENVLGGLHQFVDEGIIRPNPAMRPYIGNDQRFAMLWMLKSFMWGYTMQVLGYTWNRTQQRWGEEEGARRFYAALPYLTLAALTIPLAALGMEMRWLIAPPKTGEKQGWDYWFEALQRSGATGLGQLAVDMWETEQHGKLSLIAPFGPVVSQLYDFSTKDLGANAWRSLPAYPLASRLRDALSD